MRPNTLAPEQLPAEPLLEEEAPEWWPPQTRGLPRASVTLDRQDFGTHGTSPWASMGNPDPSRGKQMLKLFI